jgi:hypothetical protein
MGGVWGSCRADQKAPAVSGVLVRVLERRRTCKMVKERGIRLAYYLVAGLWHV